MGAKGQDAVHAHCKTYALTLKPHVSVSPRQITQCLYPKRCYFYPP